MPSKRYLEAKKHIDSKKVYSIDEAIDVLKKTASTKFNESVEAHFHLGIDPKKSDQLIRGTIAFPNGVGKTKRVAAFVESAKEAEAKEAGADLIGNDELIAEIAQKQTIPFDVAVATPSMMPKLAKLAKLLGPRGMMPNPKTDTVGTNIKKMVEEQKAGKQSFKNDDTSNVHQIFGKASFDAAMLKENLVVLLEAIKKTKPNSAKGIFIQNFTITTTMGPGIKVDPNA